MSERFESTYFIYPFSLKEKGDENKTINQIFSLMKSGVIISKDKCQLVTPGCTFYSEADIKNIGIDEACALAQKTYGADYCTVFRIPNQYLGLGDNPENLDISPIMFQANPSEDNKNYSIMKSLMYGIYSEPTGYVSNTNYAEVCSINGLLADEQKKKIAEIASGDVKYQNMLAFDSSLRSRYSFTSDIDAEKNKEINEFYLGENSPYNITASKYSRDKSAHVITQEEFMNAVNKNRSMGM